MSLHRQPATRALCWALLLLAALAFGSAQRAQAQFVQQQVGGVSIDAQGIVSNVRIGELGELIRVRQAAMQPQSDDLQTPGLRKVSLRALEAAIAKLRETGAPLTDEMRYLAGMQRIQYVFVYPEQKDIVLAGPGEGWKIDAHGEVIGAKSGRPVLLLDDLLVALRSTEMSARGGINCSIDPTPQGLSRLQALYRKVSTVGDDPSPLMAAVEEAMGLQTITISGVPQESHFARVLLAADYRMKRLAMAFEEAPLPELPSFLHMMKSSAKNSRSMLPRFWLAPKYDALVRDADGLAWEFRTAGVQAFTEEEVANTSGEKQKAAKANPLAKKWADNMTAQYDKLSVKEPIFGQLRNCMDVAVVAALIYKEQLGPKCGWDMALLMNPSLPVEAYHAPKNVPSQASVLQKGTDWIISASGGIQIAPWQPLESNAVKPQLSDERTKATARGDRWWWN